MYVFCFRPPHLTPDNTCQGVTYNAPKLLTPREVVKTPCVWRGKNRSEGAFKLWRKALIAFPTVETMETRERRSCNQSGCM